MPKLLQINPVLRMNTSTGRIMQEIGDVAMSAGWESFVAYSKGRDGMRESTSKTVPVGNRFSVAVHGLGTRLFDRHGLASNGATKAFIKKIEEIDPDIIHIHHPDPMAAMALRLSGYKGKVVLHWHSDILSQKALLRFYLPIQNWLIKRADTIVGTTPVYLAESPYLQGVQEKCRCIPIGIEPVISDSAREQEIRNEYSGRRIIFSLGRLVEYKGYRYLIEAAKYLDDSFMILIGGGGPLRESLQREIDELGVGSRVKLLGKVPQEDLASYYGACELFCMSSVMKTEAFGIVQIEAMSAGRPVVATKIPESGVSWVNEDGVSGINVAPRDSKAIAEAILTITDNEATWKKFSAGAAKRFAENFTKEKMISKCLNIYAETLSLH